jgi:hypothetical protein
MNLKDFLSISGEPGLYKFIAQGRNAIIVEHLETKRRKTAHSSSKVSLLEEISVFSEKEDIPLSKVFDLIFEKENGGPAVDAKSDAVKLKSYFEEIIPEYDKDRVYVSDMKKVVLWYNILQKLGQLVKDDSESGKDKKEESGSDVKSETKPKPKTKPKAASKPKSGTAVKSRSKTASTISKGRPKSK